ncbi:hypothetical protein [Candidatus Frankia nodulisporulans]|uniref:hypothetical protein n=1 Tax=Candidatus Frankia nodulisporulans TaxID=2060052 RepID=UPI0013CF7DE1|nr:hypothetical protein [Candidatus Frankia nodulisporulans]
MPSKDVLAESPPTPAAAPAQPAAKLGSYYGSYQGKAAYVRETSAGSWQVKVHDPTNRLAGHDGWLMLGTGWPTLPDACAATGVR